MDLSDPIVRHRRDRRLIGGALVALFFVVGLIYFLTQRSEGAPQPLIANRLLLFLLWYVNVILILTILFVVVRHVFRILVDRRNRILGSRFQTKLVLTAIGLSFIPVLILFPFATRLLLDSFDQWFSLPIEDVVRQGRETAEALSKQVEHTNQRDARRVLDEIRDVDLEDLDQRPRFVNRCSELFEQYQLDYLAIFDGTESIHALANPRTFSRDPRLRGLNRFLEEAIARGTAVRVGDTLDIEGRLVLAAVAGARPPGAHDALLADGEPLVGPVQPKYTVVVVGSVLPPDVTEKSDNLIRAYQRYLQQVVLREEVRTSYLLILLMVSLLVVLAFTSIGLRLTRRVMVPIQALAQGTKRISSGDLDHRIDVAVDDELGVLVDAFNTMTEELQRNKELVDRGNRELVEANKRLATVLENVAAGVLSIDAKGRIRTCNSAALGILHQREADVLGKTLEEAWGDPERGKLVRLLADERALRRQSSHQVRLTVANTWKTLEAKVSFLPGAGDEPVGQVVVLEDLTELIYAQKMAAWTEVARRIAHEIKNPLTPIKLAAERLLRKHQQGDPNLGRRLEEGVEIIRREVESLKSMVDEFSRYARMPRPQPKDVDLTRFVPETLQLYRGLKPGVEVVADVDPQASTVRFDPEQLKSVLVNLLDNALEWTEAPGEVRVSTRLRNGQFLLHVADTGRGVPDEDISKLFQPYFSTKGRGTGLGLAIVQRIVADHNAQIRVGNNHPRGTVFTLEIPLQ